MDAHKTGRFIAELRKQKGLTQKELAEKLMVTDKAVSRWETGKGFPDTSLLAPLGEVLGVSANELLSGNPAQKPEASAPPDKITADPLSEVKRMLLRLAKAVFFILGPCLMLSPLVSASRNFIWVLGIAMTAAAILLACAEKTGKAQSRLFPAAAAALQCAALILEILPLGAVMVFAAGPDGRFVEVCSYFSLLPLGYANFAPMLTEIATIAAILFGVLAAAAPGAPSKNKKRAFVCSAAAFLLSLAPLLLFGTIAMTAASYAVSGAILLSACLQAAGRKNHP